MRTTQTGSLSTQQESGSSRKRRSKQHHVEIPNVFTGALTDTSVVLMMRLGTQDDVKSLVCFCFCLQKGFGG